MPRILANSRHYYCVVHGIEKKWAACSHQSLLPSVSILWRSGTSSCLSQVKLNCEEKQHLQVCCQKGFSADVNDGSSQSSRKQWAGLISTSTRCSSAYAPSNVQCTCSKLAPAQPESGNKTDLSEIQGTAKGTISAEAPGEAMLVHPRSESGP